MITVTPRAWTGSPMEIAFAETRANRTPGVSARVSQLRGLPPAEVFPWFYCPNYRLSNSLAATATAEMGYLLHLTACLHYRTFITARLWTIGMCWGNSAIIMPCLRWVVWKAKLSWHPLRHAPFSPYSEGCHPCSGVKQEMTIVPTRCIKIRTKMPYMPLILFNGKKFDALPL